MKWVLENKLNKNGGVVRNIERLVLKCYEQIEGLDINESLSPIAWLEAIHMFFDFSSFKKFKAYQIDVKSYAYNIYDNKE